MLSDFSIDLGKKVLYAIVAAMIVLSSRLKCLLLALLDDKWLVKAQTSVLQAHFHKEISGFDEFSLKRSLLKI